MKSLNLSKNVGGKFNTHSYNSSNGVSTYASSLSYTAAMHAAHNLAGYSLSGYFSKDFKILKLIANQICV